MIWYFVATIVGIILCPVVAILVSMYKAYRRLDYYRAQKGAYVHFHPLKGFFSLMDEDLPNNKSFSNLGTITKLAHDSGEKHGIVVANHPLRPASLVTIYSNDAVRDFLLNENYFHKETYIPEVQKLASFFWMNGEECYKLKALFQDIFNFNGVEDFYPRLANLIQHGFTKFIKDHNVDSENFQRINIYDLIEPIMAMLSYLFIFGRYSTEIPDNIKELNTLMMQFYKEAWKRIQNPLFLWFPHLTRKYKLSSIYNAIESYRGRQAELLEAIVKEREALDEKDLQACVIDRIVLHNRKMRAEGKTADILTTDQIVGAFNLFFFAGTDTTSTLTISMICKMAGDKRVLEMLKPLANEVFDKDGVTTYEKVDGNEKLERFMKESLRLYPALGIQLDRRALRDVKLGDYWIKKDDLVNVFMFTMHRDPTVFDNPDHFDPDRFLKENEKDRPKYQYIPFAFGKRICLGRHMGNLTAKLLLCQFVRNFDFNRPEDADYYMQNLTTNRVMKPYVNIKKISA